MVFQTFNCLLGLWKWIPRKHQELLNRKLNCSWKSGGCSPRHRARAPTCPHLLEPLRKCREVEEFLQGRAEFVPQEFSAELEAPSCFLLPALFSPGSWKSPASQFTCSKDPKMREKWVFLSAERMQLGEKNRNGNGGRGLREQSSCWQNYTVMSYPSCVPAHF